jgi:hypothetical protein
MELSLQVPLLEQSVRLKQLGVVQKSLLYHVNVLNDGWRVHYSWGWEWTAALRGYPRYSAYVLSELQQMITHPTITKNWTIDIRYEKGVWEVYSTISNWVLARFDSPVWATAERVINLIEGRHISIDEVNKHLTREIKF